MRSRPIARLTLVVAALLLYGAGIQAVSVEHLTLGEIVDRADRIVRGTVIAADETTLAAGGGRLPIVVYRIRVGEVLKGAAPDGDVIELRLLSPGKMAAPRNRATSLLRDLPQFRVGQQYLLALTRPSAIGLSTTVGLGQGLFELRGGQGREEAVNQVNNAGLLDDGVVTAAAPDARAAAPAASAAGAGRSAGPIPYAELANEIRARLGR
jgi:hypothetical protein